MSGGWQTQRLSWLLEPVSSGAKGDEQVLSVYRDHGIVPKAGRTDNYNRTPVDLTRYQVVAVGDVVVNRMKAWQGSLGISPYRGIVSPDYEVLRPRTRDLDRRFLHMALRSRALIDQYALRSTGIRPSQWRLYWDQMKTIEILVPPEAEQRAIADFLDRETAQIDALIAKQEQLIQTLRERKVALVARPLTDVDPRYITTLKRVASIQTGVTLSGEGEQTDPAWPYLRVANVQVGYVNLDRIATLRLPEREARQSTLRPGDVLMTEGGDIDKLGRGALWRGEVDGILHQNHIFAVRPSDRLDSRFLVYWLDGPAARFYFRTTARKTTNLASTNKWTLGNLPVFCPDISEQVRIVAVLDEQMAKIDSLIAKAGEFIALAKERRAALITAAVTGQIDVAKAA